MKAARSARGRGRAEWNEMVCVSCGTEIADKAIVCYRCGTPTAIPAARVAPPAPRRASPWPWVLTGTTAVLGAATTWLPSTSSWDLPAGIGAGVALVAAVAAWVRAR